MAPAATITSGSGIASAAAKTVEWMATGQENGKTVYEVEVVSNGKGQEIEISESGKGARAQGSARREVAHDTFGSTASEAGNTAEAHGNRTHLAKTPYAILERRKRDNAKDLTRDDEGWLFPGIDQENKVGPVAELRQSTTTRKNGKRVIEGRFPVEDVHSLRRTWESIANDEGITELDQHVLSNHSFGSHNVNATYISQHIDHLAACAEKIDAGIKRRIEGKQPTKRKTKRRHLRLIG